MAKRFGSRGLSKHRSYTLEEAALIIGAATGTLRHWGDHGGLDVMKSQKPHIVQGAVLIAYLDARKPKKRPCRKPGEFDCWGCDTRGLPLGLMADYMPMTATTGRLSALCGACEGNVGTIIGAAGFARYAEILEIANRAE